MDFMSNMWSKTGLKKGDQEDKQELDPSTDNSNATTEQQEQQQQSDQQKNGKQLIPTASFRFLGHSLHSISLFCSNL